jgi:hypothetical protein
MNLLSSSLLTQISNKPLQTLLRSDNSNIDEQFKKLITKSKIPDYRLQIEIPDSFDGRIVWNGMLTPVQNQGTCGSCWSFASTSTLADLFNIQSMGLYNINLSAARLILCDNLVNLDKYTSKYKSKYTSNYSNNTSSTPHTPSKPTISSCFGNTLFNAWNYLYILGTNTEQCIPYNKKYGIFNEYPGLGSFTSPVKMPICSTVSGPGGDMCSNILYNPSIAEENGTPAQFYRALHIFAIAGIPKDGGNESNIRLNIFNWGPVSAAMQVYPDFYTFNSKTDIYKWNGKGPKVGGHAVEIQGWGEEKGVKFWIIKNSWGIEWGDKGYFKMIRGINNCEIEENIITGQPDFFYPINYIHHNFSFTSSELQNSIQLHNKIASDVMTIGGGIDPTTGYSRRVMATKAWVNLGRFVKLDDLPDLNTFVAGLDTSPKKRILYKAKLKSRNKDISYGDQSMNMVIFLLSVLVFSIIVILILYKFK